MVRQGKRNCEGPRIPFPVQKKKKEKEEIKKTKKQQPNLEPCSGPTIYIIYREGMEHETMVLIVELSREEI